jgi:hypothetical protein
MVLSALRRTLDTEAICLGAISFVLAFVLAALAMKVLPRFLDIPILLAPYVLSGVVVGYRAKRCPLKNAAILGALTGLLLVLVSSSAVGVSLGGFEFVLGEMLPAWVIMHALGVALSVIGVLVGEDVAKYRRAA